MNLYFLKRPKPIECNLISNNFSFQEDNKHPKFQSAQQQSQRPKQHHKLISKPAAFKTEFQTRNRKHHTQLHYFNNQIKWPACPCAFSKQNVKQETSINKFRIKEWIPQFELLYQNREQLRELSDSPPQTWCGDNHTKLGQYKSTILINKVIRTSNNDQEIAANNLKTSKQIMRTRTTKVAFHYCSPNKRLVFLCF